MATGRPTKLATARATSLRPLAAGAGGAQLVDRQPRRDGRDERTRRFDLLAAIARVTYSLKPRET
jgi:hypothetical protein